MGAHGTVGRPPDRSFVESKVTGALARVLPAIGAVVASGILMASILRTFSSRVTIEADLSTYVLPAVERARGFGAIYVDFLDIKPPLTYAIFVPWIASFGHSLVGLWCLYLLMVGAALTAFWLLLRMQLTPWISLAVFVSCDVVVTQSGMLDWFLFPTEVIGLVPLLWGLVLARQYGHRLLALALAGFLLTLAGQAKDVYFFAPLALIPAILHQQRKFRALAAWVTGNAVAYLATIAVLVWWGSGALAAYIDVLGIKRERFPFPGMTQIASSLWQQAVVVNSWLPLLWLLVVAIGLSLVFRRKRDFERVPNPPTQTRISWSEAMYICAFLCVVVGFVWQGSSLAQYFAIAFVFPLFIALSATLSWVQRRSFNEGAYTRVLAVVLVAASIIPAWSLNSGFIGMTKTMRPWEDAKRIRSSESAADVSGYSEIQRLSTLDGCLHVAYGWNASAYYLYTGLKPCTRFMLPPLAASTVPLASELQREVISRPPDILVVDLAQQIPFDDVAGRNERTLLPFDAIAKSCYRPTPVSPTVFVMRDSTSLTRTCIAAAFQAEREDSSN